LSEERIPAMSSTLVDRPPSFQHYQLLIDDARALAERRDRVSNIFLSVITLTLGAQGYLLVTNKDDDVRSTMLIWLAALFGTWLCVTWRQAILSFKELLNFRYFILKRWERDVFPEDERYYIAEDVLYRVHDKGQVEIPPLAAEYVRHRKIPYFSDTYRRLPTAAMLALWGIALVRAAFLLVLAFTSGTGIHLGA
jgi:hypothetical protein